MYLVTDVFVFQLVSNGECCLNQATEAIVCTKAEIVAEALKGGKVSWYVRWWLVDGVLHEMDDYRRFTPRPEVTIQNYQFTYNGNEQPKDQDIDTHVREAVRNNVWQPYIIDLAIREHGITHTAKHLPEEE